MIFETIERQQDFIVSHFEDLYEDACKSSKNALEEKMKVESIIKYITDYKISFMAALEMGIREYQKHNQATFINNETCEIPNVFDCIKKNDNKLFLRSFENGVDLSVCNADGYNPMTLAVEYGNNTMVKFLLDHNADPAIKDRRGYNAFHTAVENQYRDICKMLLDVDPDLINSKTSSGETVDSLAKKQTFLMWITEEIDNAI